MPVSPAEITGPVPHLGRLKNPQLCQGPLESLSSVPDRNRFEAGLQEEGSHGRHLQHRLGSSVHGQTSDRRILEQHWHINCLEMMTVLLALRAFPPDLKGYHVLLCSDNMIVVAYVNHQGVAASVQAGEAACAQHNFHSLNKVHVLSRLNQALENDSDEMHSVPTFNRQLAPPVLAC